jgi:hypothetical protein
MRFAGASVGRKQDVPRDRSLQLEPHLVAMIAQPLPLQTALLGLSRQQSLIAPVKFALTAEGVGCAIAEISRVADLHDCEKLAGQALDAVERWLECECPSCDTAPADSESPLIARDTTDPVDSEIAQSLDELGWSWKAIGEAKYQIHVATDSGSIGRVEIQQIGSNAVRASSVSTVRVDDAIAREALAHFALEANRRLRIARLTVFSAEDDATQLVWDAVAPAELPTLAVLPRLIEAVGFARAETSLAIVALADEQIAGAYLDHRFPMPRKFELQGQAYSTTDGAVPAERR